jgi:hypothetical protein
MRNPLIIVCLILAGWIAAAFKLSYSLGHSNGYTQGFSKGLDTAAAIDDKSFDSLMFEMRVMQAESESILEELQAKQVDSFINHSEIPAPCQ